MIRRTFLAVVLASLFPGVSVSQGPPKYRVVIKEPSDRLSVGWLEIWTPKGYLPNVILQKVGNDWHRYDLGDDGEYRRVPNGEKVLI